MKYRIKKRIWADKASDAFNWIAFGLALAFVSLILLLA